MGSPLIEFNHISAGTRNERPIVLLHGFTGSANDWRPIIEHLRDTHYCIAIDLPGHGETKVNGGDEHYTFEKTAEQLISWFDSNEIEKADLVGYSMGGRLALYILVNYPDRFGKGVLESSSPGLASADDRAARIEHDKQMAEKLLRQPLEDFLKDWYEQPVFSSLKKQPGLIQQLTAARKDSNVDELARSLRGMSTGRQLSLWNELAKIRSDVRLIVGADDHKFVSIANEMQKCNEKISLSVVEDSGHIVHLEQQGCFYDILSKFLEIKTGE